MGYIATQTFSAFKNDWEIYFWKIQKLKMFKSLQLTSNSVYRCTINSMTKLGHQLMYIQSMLINAYKVILKNNTIHFVELGEQNVICVVFSTF